MSYKTLRGSLFLICMLMVSVMLTGCAAAFAPVLSFIGSISGGLSGFLGSIGGIGGVIGNVVAGIRSVAGPILQGALNVMGRVQPIVDSVRGVIGQARPVVDTLRNIGSTVRNVFSGRDQDDAGATRPAGRATARVVHDPDAEGPTVAGGGAPTAADGGARIAPARPRTAIDRNAVVQQLATPEQLATLQNSITNTQRYVTQQVAALESALNNVNLTAAQRQELQELTRNMKAMEGLIQSLPQGTVQVASEVERIKAQLQIGQQHVQQIVDQARGIADGVTALVDGVSRDFAALRRSFRRR